jgi:2-hydroxy-6-oxonona-2,4-dienedioate hydrolase
MTPTTGTADANGATLYYEVAGEGEPLVLVHAGIADGRMWDAQVVTFSRRYRVIRHDMRGFGRSPMVAGPYSHHADLRALLDALEVERAAFVGCSMGGATVIDFALENPERVEALVLVGSAVGGFEFDEEPPEEWDELVAADEAGDLERVSELEVRMWVDGPRRGPDAVDPGVRNLVREMNLIALENEALQLGEELEPLAPAATRLSQIRAHTLVLVGDEDRPRTLAAADLLERDLRNARKTVMPGTAHLPNMEHPEEFDRLVLDFLKS